MKCKDFVLLSWSKEPPHHSSECNGKIITQAYKTSAIIISAMRLVHGGDPYSDTVAHQFISFQTKPE